MKIIFRNIQLILTMKVRFWHILRTLNFFQHFRFFCQIGMYVTLILTHPRRRTPFSEMTLQISSGRIRGPRLLYMSLDLAYWYSCLTFNTFIPSLPAGRGLSLPFPPQTMTPEAEGCLWQRYMGYVCAKKSKC